MTQRVQITNLRPRPGINYKRWAEGLTGKYGFIIASGPTDTQEKLYKITVEGRQGEELLYEDEFQNVNALAGRRKHRWVSSQEKDSDVNLECTRCGFQQSPEVNGKRNYIKFFYRKNSKSEWFQSETVPLCELKQS
jgi:hypothetical protein